MLYGFIERTVRAYVEKNYGVVEMYDFNRNLVLFVSDSGNCSPLTISDLCMMIDIAE